LQSGKGIPKSLWWKIEANFLISFFWGGGGAEGRRCLLFWNILDGDLGELVFQQNLISFMKSKIERRKRKGKKVY